MHKITFGIYNPADWIQMRNWCFSQFGETGDWEYRIDIGGHGRILTFLFRNDRDRTLFALRWVNEYSS